MTKHINLMLAAMLAVTLLTAGCGRFSAEDDSQPPPREARSEVERGPVKVTVEVTPADVALSGQPKLTLVVDHAEDVLVDMPVFGEVLGDFRVLDIKEPLPKLKEGRKTQSQILTLEPTRIGELAIFPVPVSFTDSREQGDGKQHLLQTEPLMVKVTTVVSSKQPSLDELRGKAPPIGLPTDRLLLWIALGSGVLLLGGGTLIWWLRWRRPKIAAAKILSAQEIASMELDDLLGDKLAERDVKLFYVELTGIVRRYIESTKGVRAPEQTTEEFLREITGRKTFSAEENHRLKYFLEAADLVKFAGYRPERDDVESSCHRAKEFIDYAQEEEEVSA
jgi:hypothetical protein